MFVTPGQLPVIPPIAQNALTLGNPMQSMLSLAGQSYFSSTGLFPVFPGQTMIRQASPLLLDTQPVNPPNGDEQAQENKKKASITQITPNSPDSKHQAYDPSKNVQRPSVGDLDASVGKSSSEN